jgi:hypothetical protein
VPLVSASAHKEAFSATASFTVQLAASTRVGSGFGSELGAAMGAGAGSATAAGGAASAVARFLLLVFMESLVSAGNAHRPELTDSGRFGPIRGRYRHFDGPL